MEQEIFGDVMETVKCPACGAIAQARRFCTRCGADVRSMTVPLNETSDLPIAMTERPAKKSYFKPILLSIVGLLIIVGAAGGWIAYKRIREPLAAYNITKRTY